MKKFIIAPLAILASVGFVTAGTSRMPLQRFDLTAHTFKSHNNTHAFAPARVAQIERTNAMLFGNANAKASLLNNTEPTTGFEPTRNFGPTHYFGDLDAPGNQTWFYTVDLENKPVYVSEYFTDYYLQAFTINIYDGNGTLLGTVHDKLRTQGLETGRAPYSDLLPVATQHYFNTDDKYEIIFGVALNTSIPGEVYYRSFVYSLGGEKDGDGNDVPVYTMDAFVGDVLDATVPGGPENIYMSTVSEEYGGVTWEDQDTPEFWDKYTASKLTVHTYGPVDATGKLPELLTYDIPLQQLPGDQESGGYCLSLTHDGSPYMVLSKLEQTLTDPFFNIQADMTQRETNNLVIDVYKLTPTAAELTQTTKIPFSKVDDEGVQFTFCGIGFMRWAQDINFTDYDSAGKAAFTVTKSNYKFATDGVDGYSYYIYNPDGTLRNTLWEEVQSTSAMSDIPGHERQQLFITYDEDGYRFHFYDLKSCRETASFTHEITVDDSDPDMITSNLDRVADGDTYKYAVEMRLPTEEDDQAYMRVAWFNADGSFSHIEEVNMGKNVNYAMCYISGAALHHDAFFEDEHHEYMMLIKRGHEDTSASTEELLIGQVRTEDYPEGRNLLLLSADERGALANIVPYLHVENPYLSVTYKDGSNYSVDHYALPLGSDAGVDEIERDLNGAASAIHFDGNVIACNGNEISVYSLQGINVLNGYESVDASVLTPGVYVAKAAGETIKICVK